MTSSTVRKSRVKMQAIRKRAAIERRHDDEVVVASRVTVMARLDAMQAALGDRCPACGESAENADLYDVRGVPWRRCRTCFERAPDRREMPVPASITRALERMVNGGA